MLFVGGEAEVLDAELVLGADDFFFRLAVVHFDVSSVTMLAFPLVTYRTASKSANIDKKYQR